MNRRLSRDVPSCHLQCFTYEREEQAMTTDESTTCCAGGMLSIFVQGPSVRARIEQARPLGPFVGVYLKNLIGRQLNASSLAMHVSRTVRYHPSIHLVARPPMNVIDFQRAETVRVRQAVNLGGTFVRLSSPGLCNSNTSGESFKSTTTRAILNFGVQGKQASLELEAELFLRFPSATVGTTDTNNVCCYDFIRSTQLRTRFNCRHLTSFATGSLM